MAPPTKCLVCSSSRLKNTLYEDTVFNSKIFTYVKCRDCNLVFVYPLPEPETLSEMYSPKYHYEIDGDREPAFDLGKLIAQYGKGNRFLDYGCGRGGNLTIAQKHQYETYGVEYNASFIEQLKSQFIQSKFYLVSEFWKLDQVNFDIILLSNVLEHFTDPQRILVNLKSKLSIRGILIVEGPIEANFTIAGFIRNLLFGIRKLVLKRKSSHPPFHLFYSNLKNQKLLFQKTGYKILDFKITEQAWPFPSQIVTSDTFKNKVLYFIAKFSIYISKKVPFLGNYFICVLEPIESSSQD